MKASYRIKISDLLSGKYVWPLYNEYNKTQWYDKDEMRKFQLLKLKKLLLHCRENVPYYSNIIRKKGIDIDNIRSVDVLKKFPILTKEIIQENYEAFIPKNIKSIKGVKYSQTGGTTGNILIKRTDANVRSSTWATFNRFQNWMGITDNTRILRLMGGHVLKHSILNDIKRKFNDFIDNTISLNPYDKSENNIKKIIDTLEYGKIDSIRGYSQNLFFLANHFKDINKKFNVKSITTTAEPLMPEHRKLFKEVFNAETFDQYGCGEIGGIAYECEYHSGLHVAEERVILEFENEIDLLITDLDNFALPYIRYSNGDQAVVSNDVCGCGRKSLVLKKIMGRTCDYISCPDGKQLHWAYFWHLLFDSNIANKKNLKKFQILQKSWDKIYFRIVSDPLDVEDKELLVNSMKKSIGQNIDIEFIQEEDIENASSGKYRPVVNEMIL